MIELTDANRPYTSCHEHLADLLVRCSDLAAAHVARGPVGIRGRGVDVDELVERSMQRASCVVPTEVQQLWKNADARLAHIEAREAVTTMDLPLRRLQRTLGLSKLEVDALLLCAAPQLDARYTAEWERINIEFVRPSIRTIIATLGRTFEEQLKVRQLFSLEGALFKTSTLLALRHGAASESDFLAHELEVPRRIISELLGDSAVDDCLLAFSSLRVPLDRLEDVVLPNGVRETVLELVAGHQARIAQCTAWGLDQIVTHGRGTTLLFSGPPGTGKTMLAHAVARETGHRILSVDLGRLMRAGRDVESNLDAVFREGKLQNAILFFDEAEQIFASREMGNSLMQQLLTRFDAFDGVAILASNMPEMFDDAMQRRIVARIDLPLPGPQARSAIWRHHLPPALPLAADVDLEKLALEIDLTGGTIKNAVHAAVQRALVRGSAHIGLDDLLHGARLQSRVRSALVQHVYRPERALNDLVLSPELRGLTDQLVAAARARSTVLLDWGFGRTLGVGSSLVALFSGPPGTGKTATAEAIGHALERPILRCDVTNVLSRWVGETAKNLELFFDAARAQRAILLFEEADALFARRVRVQTATDRAMNGETAALLNLLDRFDGLAILTTNSAADLDPAFARRIQFKATFSAPDALMRTALWRKLLSTDAPLHADVDTSRLARAFALTGGEIRSSILTAALEAASLPSSQRAITQTMLERAAGAHISAEPIASRKPSPGVVS